jgi:hypothetical protein
MDDDEEKGRDRWRMRPPEEEDDDEYYDDEPAFARLPRSELRAIATDQKAVMICILLYIAFAVAGFFIPKENQLPLWICVIGLGLAATIKVFLLATKVFGGGLGIVLAILTLIPCIGLIILLVINGKATTILKRHKIHVGFLGAKLSDI